MNRLLLSIALSALAGSASAADLDMGETEPGRDTSAWALQITPYMWAAGLDGRVSPFRRGPTLEVDKSFSDVLEDLNLGGFVNVWGRAENFVFAADVMYVDTTGAEGTGPLPAFSIPGIGTIPPGAEVDASIDTTEFMASLQGGYRILDAGGITLDALAGARFWHISNDVTVTVSVPFLGSRRASYGESFGWVDPIVGLRGFVPVTERLSIQAQADIGGFGAGSDRTWSAMATANYVFTEKLSASVGYKVLDVDYDDDGHVFDTQLSGPVLGMTYRF